MDDIPKMEMAPIFEAYGKACYVCQNLESSFRFLLICNASKSTNAEISKTAIDVETETAQFTLNKLFRLAQEKEYFTKKDISILIKANRTRNHVIHHYWNENNVNKMMTSEGRLSLKSDLEKITSEIQDADRIMVSLIDNYLIEYGLTTKILKAMAAQTYEEGSFDIPRIKH